MPKTPGALEILEGLGYDPVDIESDADYIRALKESFNKLQIQNPSDPRLEPLADAVKGYRQAKSKKEAAKSGGKSRAAKRRKGESFDDVKAKIDAKEKKKKDAMNFISPGSAPPALPPAEADGGGDMSSTLMKISNDVNIIKGIVEAQKDISKDQAEDTREAREKKKRSMKENLLEGTKGGIKKVGGAVRKLLKPAENIFMTILKFLTTFLLGTGLMKLLDWMGNGENQKKMDSIFRFLKDYWPTIVTALAAFIPGFPVLAAVIGLAVGFLPKLIKLVKSLLGFGKDVDKEIKNNEKELTGDKTDDLTIDSSVTPREDRTDAEKQKFDEMSKEKNFNKGGEVPGSGNTDTVPAMLTPGEFVLTKEAVNQIGADTLYNMNAAAGGVGKPSQQKPAKKKKKKTSTVGTMMNLGGLKMGGMTNNMSYGGGGMVDNTQYMKLGGQVPVQHMFMGGLVKKIGGVIAKTPQARLIRFAADQVKKAAVSPPAAKALSALKKLGVVPSTPSIDDVSMPDEPTDRIPAFDAIAPGGRAKEQTLGIRR